MISNVVDLLERMGQDARLRHAAAGDIERLLEENAIDQSVWTTLQSADPRQLEELAGARANICCMVHAPEDDEEEDEEDGDDDEGEESPEEDDPNAASAY